MLTVFFLAIGIGWLIYLAVRPRRDEQAIRTARARERAEELYAAAKVLCAEKAFPTADQFATLVWRELEVKFDDTFPALGISAGAIEIARALYEREGFDPISPPPPDGTELDFARYSDAISHVITKLSNADTLTV